MKNISKIFSIVLVLLLVFSLTACDFLNNGGSQDDKLESSKQEVEAKLNNLAAQSGFEITYKYESSESSEASYATIGAYKNYSWYYNGDKESGLAYEKDKELTIYYLLKDGVWEYQYAYLHDKNDSHYSNRDLTHEFSMFLQAYEFDSGFSKTSQATIAGRKCDVYTYSVSQKGQIVSSLTGVDAKWSYYIDKELGICLKFEVSGDDGSSTSTSTFEVTEFKTNVNIEGLKRPVDVYPINAPDPNVSGNWNMLAFVGLSNIALDEEAFLSDDTYHSMEVLGLGSAIYYFKVEDIASIDDALDYMSDYYTLVVNAIKQSSDDHKCYSGEDVDNLVELSEVIEDESLLFNMVFLYHEQYYEISFMLEESIEDNQIYILEISVNKAY